MWRTVCISVTALTVFMQKHLICYISNMSSIAITACTSGQASSLTIRAGLLYLFFGGQGGLGLQHFGLPAVMNQLQVE